MKSTWSPRKTKKTFSASLSSLSLSSLRFNTSLKSQLGAMELSENSFREMVAELSEQNMKLPDRHFSLRQSNEGIPSFVDGDFVFSRLAACDASIPTGSEHASSARTMSPARSSGRDPPSVGSSQFWDEGAASLESSTPSSRDPSLSPQAASRQRQRSLMDIAPYEKSLRTCCIVASGSSPGRMEHDIEGKPSSMLLTLESVEEWGKCVISPVAQRYGAGFHPLSSTHAALRPTCKLQPES